MIRLLCLLVVLSAVSTQDVTWISEDCGLSKYPDAGEDQRKDTHIINGWDARPGEFPWQGALLYFGSHNCGCVIISSQWVLTAAHCVDSGTATQYTVVVGQHSRLASDGVSHDIDYFTIHENYDETGEIENDIAVIQLVEPIVMSEDVTAPCRPEGSYDSRYSTTSGWGTTEDGSLADILQYGNEPIVPQDTCVGCFGAGWILPGMLCFGSCDGSHNQATCSGDSGGPCVVRNGEQFDIVGLTSWGLSGGCLQDTPKVFTNVSYFNEWVDINADPL